ncbi:MAG: hypothetical protein MRY59_09795 [Aquisalinus sp.]|nr:hypothetical protein [Aquisalinus sp.]
MKGRFSYLSPTLLSRQELAADWSRPFVDAGTLVNYRPRVEELPAVNRNTPENSPTDSAPHNRQAA